MFKLNLSTILSNNASTTTDTPNTNEQSSSPRSQGSYEEEDDTIQEESIPSRTMPAMSTGISLSLNLSSLNSTTAAPALSSGSNPDSLDLTPLSSSSGAPAGTGPIGPTLRVPTLSLGNIATNASSSSLTPGSAQTNLSSNSDRTPSSQRTSSDTPRSQSAGSNKGMPKLELPLTRPASASQTSPRIHPTTSAKPKPRTGTSFAKEPSQSQQISPAKESAQTSEKQVKSIKIDLVVPDFCSVEIPANTAPATQQQLIREEIHKNWFGKSTMQKVKPKKRTYELYKPVPLNPSSSEGEQMADTERYLCQPNEAELTVELLKRVLYENQMLKTKLDKSSQALTTFEKENQRLRKELKQQGGATSNLVPAAGASSSTLPPEQEVEILRAKVQKHEQFRTEMLRTVESLKVQHAKLAKAIISQQQLHESLASFSKQDE